MTSYEELHSSAHRKNSLVLLVPDDPKSLAVRDTIDAFNRLVPRYHFLHLWHSKLPEVHALFDTVFEYTLVYQGKNDKDTHRLESDEGMTFQEMVDFLTTFVRPPIKLFDAVAAHELFT